MFTKAELDAARPANHVFVQRSAFSGTQVNTRALMELGLGSRDLVGIEVDGRASRRPG
ncbi:MAG: hypothetical protein ACRDMY_09740 [Gaiellaceae bacterium]